ncbi:hypothetical protein V5O48_013353 [Marasmius crinis-equi]|uniref:Uncharacterized protein n=1 Tax=Marasmius crinis-equi TaxID=585013 RepID=A0ABR3F0A9_9AGAR
MYTPDLYANLDATRYSRDKGVCQRVLLYDGPGPNARLVAVEYLITPEIYATLPQGEKCLWYPRVPTLEIDHQKSSEASSSGTGRDTEMTQLYVKVYPLWKVEHQYRSGNQPPLGEPQVITCFRTESTEAPELVDETYALIRSLEV